MKETLYLSVINILNEKDISLLKVMTFIRNLDIFPYFGGDENHRFGSLSNYQGETTNLVSKRNTIQFHGETLTQFHGDSSILS
jgi:hypothetical protein